MFEHLPDRVSIYEVSLRDGLQNEKAMVPLGDKLRLIDALCASLYGSAFDRGGKIAASGRVLPAVLDQCLRDEFFHRPWPRTAGREEFGSAYAGLFLHRCASAQNSLKKEDILATATALTSRSIGQSIRSLSGGHRYHDLFVSGGGTKNRALMKMLSAEATSLGLQLNPTDAAGVPSPSKEAVAFALLAYQTWLGEPSNVPSATGATTSVILGKVSYV